VEGVLEGNSVVPVLNRNVVSSHMRPSVDRSAERETESEKQAGGRLHLGGRGAEGDVRSGVRRKESSRRSRSGLYNPADCLN